MPTAASKLLHITSSIFLLSQKRTVKTLAFPPFPSPRCSAPLILRLPPVQSFATTASGATASDFEVEEPPPPPSSHPWPEWETFVGKLRDKGYFRLSSSKASEDDEKIEPLAVDRKGVSGPSINQVKNACLMFARERYDILSSLPKESIKGIVQSGCPSLFRKAVNSAKRLRQYLQIEEADACSACCLRGSCDKAYAVPTEGQAARTVDVVRILLGYAVSAENLSGETNNTLSEQVQESARSLLTKLITLSDMAIDPTYPKPVILPPVKKEPSMKVINKEKQSSDIEMKRGDWLCPKCNFLNFARNMRCLECKHDGPKSVAVDGPEMKPGDWTCPTCKFMNFARNRKCFRCEEARPKRVLKPGEWECPSCYYLNFRGNKECRKCNVDCPEGAGSQLEDHLWKKPKSKMDSFKFGDDEVDDNEDMEGGEEAEDHDSDGDDILPPFKESKYVASKRATVSERRLTSARNRSNFSDLVSRTE